MLGLLQKIWVEVRWPVLFFSFGLFAVMSLLTALLPKVKAIWIKCLTRCP